MPPLPSTWIDRIFAKLALTYGQRFLGLYSGLDLEAVKRDWAHELRGYAKAPECLAYALDRLPTDKPPTVLEFRHIARNCPTQEDPKIAAPYAKPTAAVLAKIAPMLSDEVRDPKAWAHRLSASEQRGERLTMAQRSMWRAALGVEQSA